MLLSKSGKAINQRHLSCKIHIYAYICNEVDLIYATVHVVVPRCVVPGHVHSAVTDSLTILCAWGRVRNILVPLDRFENRDPERSNGYPESAECRIGNRSSSSADCSSLQYALPLFPRAFSRHSGLLDVKGLASKQEHPAMD